jgi:hypothetical protein
MVAPADDKEERPGRLTLKGPRVLPKTASKEKDRDTAVQVETSHTGNTSNSSSPLSILIHSMSLTAIATVLTQDVESPEEPTSSKVKGKKRVVEDEDEGTATEGEISIAASEPPSKKKKKQVK